MAEGASCGGCGARFTMSQVAFDRHRIHSGKHAWTCIPEWAFRVIGLWLDPAGRWGFGTAEGYEQRQQQAAKMREARKRA